MLKSRHLSRIFNIRFFSSKPAASVQNNVNYTDVEHHANLSDQWWDLSGPMKGLHAMNSLRVPLIRDGLISTGKIDEKLVNKGNVLEGVDILEVGCGAGILTEALGKLQAKVCEQYLIVSSKFNLNIPFNFQGDSTRSL